MGIITAERQRQLEQASQGSWQQRSLVILPEVQGVKGLALKKSLKEQPTVSQTPSTPVIASKLFIKLSPKVNTMKILSS